MSQQKARLAISVKDQSTKIKIIDEMHVYKLPLKSAPSYSGTSSIVKRFSFGQPNQRIRREHKTILLMGETGSGKTTMINAMINFILGVEWEDDFRFVLVDEQVRGASQAHSQTQEVTAYDLHYQDGFRIPFSLTIVDTPGFGDTRGFAQDKKITSAIETLLTQENGIEV
jgi:predicted GTPase